MAAAGADVLEVGPPYSDPLIDGPVIQQAVTAAPPAGTRLDDVLGLVNELTASVDTPVVLLVYYNLVAHRAPSGSRRAPPAPAGRSCPTCRPRRRGVAGGDPRCRDRPCILVASTRLAPAWRRPPRPDGASSTPRRRSA